MQATISAAQRRPERLTLELNDSLFVMTQSPGGRTVAPMNGEEVDIGRSNWPTKVKLQWDARTPRIERSFDEGGKVIDHFELVSRDRLIITREFEAGRGKTELHFAYDRKDGG